MHWPKELLSFFLFVSIYLFGARNPKYPISQSSSLRYSNITSFCIYPIFYRQSLVFLRLWRSERKQNRFIIQILFTNSFVSNINIVTSCNTWIRICYLITATNWLIESNTNTIFFLHSRRTRQIKRLAFTATQ